MLLLLLVQARPVAARVGFYLNAEAGPELDSNATRVSTAASAQGADPVRSGLMRLTGAGGVKLKAGARHLFALDYLGGGKVFWGESARTADEVVQQGALTWAVRTSPGMLWLTGSIYDAIQRESQRDFRSGAGTLQFSLEGPPGFSTAFQLGYRGLEYKPHGDYSFHALQGGAQLNWSLVSGRGEATVDWNLRLRYLAGPRFYQGQVTAPPGRCGDLRLPCSESGRRDDFNQVIRAEVDYLGQADASLWYAMEINRSNSYGETFHRHVVGMKFTSILFWEIYLTIKGALQFSRFRDPFLISEVSNLSFVSIDDENRSSIATQLARDLSSRFSLCLRYSLYVSESSSGAQASSLLPGSDFLRHMLFLGVRFEYSRGD